MSTPKTLAFDPASFLAEAGLGRTIVEFKNKQTIFSQGDPADSVFYIQTGRVKLTVLSTRGKEATLMVLPSGVRTRMLSPCTHASMSPPTPRMG
jgi:CRP/FNR family transcriptional regulator, cyclic AMP receptor protein